MKITAKTALTVCVILALAFLGGVGAVFVTVLLPKIKQIPQAAPPTPAQLPVPVVEYSGPPILRPQSTESLTKTAEELDQWGKDLKKQEQAQLERDQALLQREELIKNERAALNVERERLAEMQARMNEQLTSHRKEIDSRVNTINTEEDANLQKLSELYALMKVDESVELLRGTPDDQVAKILSFTKLKRQAKVLETWSTKYPDDRERILRITEVMKRLAKSS